MSLKRNLSEEDFIKWKTEWLKTKGCPFFTCAQSLERKVCGKDYICGVMYDYQKYMLNEWVQECDINLELDKEEYFPSNCCPSCTNSMCLNAEKKTGSSCCPWMNDFYEDTLKIKVDRSLEKYFMTMGSFIIPFSSEQAYLDLINNQKAFKEYLEKDKK